MNIISIFFEQKLPFGYLILSHVSKYSMLAGILDMLEPITFHVLRTNIFSLWIPKLSIELAWTF